MSPLLSEPIAADPSKHEELKAAQARFAAILRDEYPQKLTEDNIRAEQEKAQALQKEIDKNRNLNQASLEQLAEVRKESLIWLISLGHFAVVQHGCNRLVGLAVAAAQDGRRRPVV